jgi:hypothetical protein
LTTAHPSQQIWSPNIKELIWKRNQFFQSSSYSVCPPWLAR